MDAAWRNISAISSKEYQCGYCGNVVASNQGFYAQKTIEGLKAYVCICPHCAKASFILGGTITPELAPGNEVNHLPEQVEKIYREARNCMSVSAYTASVLASRKLLMNIAVSQGANENLRFIEYVDYLAENGYVPPNGRGWVDHIRRKGNEATHEIQVMEHSDATDLISFSEMLLKFIYEFPAQIPSTS